MKKILASTVADENFAALPVENRAAFWEQFQKDYPDVDVYVLYTRAKVEADKIAEEKAAKQREENRLSSLEQRVLMAEAEARNATRASQNQQYVNQYRYDNRYPSVVVVPQSYIIRTKGNGHHKPRPTNPLYNGSTLSGTVIAPGLNLNINGSYSSQSGSSSSRTHGYVNGQNGVMRIQSNDGYKRSFY
ncbi:hypothetical protein P0Y35_03330 [Kiritimatiellaeota bacterium B1221]|nr:hypothetical protein [Kiritimatiellaeota bacterium B1221]